MAGRSANGRIGEDERRQELGLCYQWRRDGQCEQPSCRLISITDDQSKWQAVCGFNSEVPCSIPNVLTIYS
uniref:Uncharacterized protein n=1 Tax=Oryza glumipatula TaxID=40148 RepID=A0A0E0BRP2_9ORYZ